MTSSERKTLNLVPLAVITTILAACSILYEMALAQVISSILGNTVHQYNLTIGIYITSLGLGAYFEEKIPSQNYFTKLIKTEGLLCLVGASAPILIIFLDGAFQSSGISLYDPLRYYPTVIFCYGMIVLIGFLSGIELPSLMKLCSKEVKSGHLKILAWDYVGSLLGALLYPTVLLSTLSIFQINFVVALLNGVVAIYLSIVTNKKLESALLVSLSLVLVLSLINHQEITELLQQNIYLGSHHD